MVQQQRGSFRLTQTCKRCLTVNHVVQHSEKAPTSHLTILLSKKSFGWHKSVKTNVSPWILNVWRRWQKDCAFSKYCQTWLTCLGWFYMCPSAATPRPTQRAARTSLIANEEEQTVWWMTTNKAPAPTSHLSTIPISSLKTCLLSKWCPARWVGQFKI